MPHYTDPAKGEVLVAILKEKSDLTILQEQGWYRVPVVSAPRRWPPRWLAFYQPRAFGDDAFKVRYFAKVDRITEVKRKQLFPNELPSARSEKRYFRLDIAGLEERSEPIISRRWRRLVFITTTWQKFQASEEINDLFDESPLEDILWASLKQLRIPAERQWGVKIGERYFFLDFALFCNKGKLAVETDGDTWHIGKEKAPQDMERDNYLVNENWYPLRFNTKQINEECSTYVMNMILGTINNLGGLQEETVVPRTFYPDANGTIQQLALFDRGDTPYQVNEDQQEPDF